jgi:hypothetical protein
MKKIIIALSLTLLADMDSERVGLRLYTKTAYFDGLALPEWHRTGDSIWSRIIRYLLVKSGLTWCRIMKQ